LANNHTQLNLQINSSEARQKKHKPWGGIEMGPAELCNEGSNRGLIALTLCRET